MWMSELDPGHLPRCAVVSCGDTARKGSMFDLRNPLVIKNGLQEDPPFIIFIVNEFPI